MGRRVAVLLRWSASVLPFRHASTMRVCSLVDPPGNGGLLSPGHRLRVFKPT